MNKPRIYVWVTQANSGEGYPGMAKGLLAKHGWRGVYEQLVKPQLDWFKGVDEPVGVVIQLPFGHWTKVMAIDAFEWAMASQCGYFTRDFDKVWGPVKDGREVIAYVGGVHRPPHLQDQPARELGWMLRRNLCALYSCSRVCIDMGSKAYTHPFTTDSGYRCELTNEILSVSVADSIFGEGTTAIEATPRNHSFCKQLRKRDTFIIETTYRSRHGRPDERRATAEAEGFGDVDYISGQIHRMLTAGYFGGNAGTLLAASQRVLREGHALVLNPQRLIDAGHSASELLAG